MIDIIEETLNIENLLNLYSGKRYHIKSNCQREDSLLSLFEIIPFSSGSKKIIIDKLPQKEFIEKIKNLPITISALTTKLKKN